MFKFLVLLLLSSSVFLQANKVSYFMTSTPNWDGDVNMVIDIINHDKTKDGDRVKYICKHALEYKQQNIHRQRLTVMYIYIYKEGGRLADTLKIRNNNCDKQ